MRAKIKNHLINSEVKDKSGNTPLHCAVLFNDDTILKILLENGATTHFEKNKRDEIPLDIATQNEKILRMILIDFLSFALKTREFNTDDLFVQCQTKLIIYFHKIQSMAI